MKKKIAMILIIIGIFSLLTISFFYNGKNKSYIETVLESDAYSYLPLEAKNLIRSIYEDTNELVLTEKNKEENDPYLNPDYIQYLTLSSEEQEEITEVPDIYTIDYVEDEEFESAVLPETFDFRDINGNNYLTPIKDQQSTGLCWSFAAIENLETLLMYKSNTPYNENSNIFSVRQMDYATSYVGLYDKEINGEKQIYSNPLNGYRTLHRGGTYVTASTIMANGLSLVDESILPWSETTDLMYTKDILNYNNSLYELNRGIQLPTLNYSKLSEEEKEPYINSYVNKVKTYMMEYGAPIIGTLSPQRTSYQYCSFKNHDGKYVVRVDDCRDKSTGTHAVQIIGWDDNYTYEYCKGDKENLDAVNGTCEEGEYKTGTGAWIIRNSWGTTMNKKVTDENGQETTETVPMPYQYFYIAYDSQYGTIAFSADVSSMSNRTWDNNYHSNIWKRKDTTNTEGETTISWDYSNTKSQTKTFDTNNNQQEKIEKIKIMTSTVDGSYQLSIQNGNNTYGSYSSGTVNEQGIYTFDLSNENILVDKNFSVTVTGNNNNKFVNDSIYVFTSNVDQDYKVKAYSENSDDVNMPASKENPIYLDSTEEDSFHLTTYLKNISANAEITYQFKNQDGTIDNNVADINTYYYNDYEETDFTNIESNTIGKTYLLEAIYQGEVIDSYFVKFYNENHETNSNVYLHSANGYIQTVSAPDKKESNFKLEELNNENFFNNGYYITGWNTKADGSGENYDIEDSIYIYTDTNLYAVWSEEPLKLNISYVCEEENCSGTIEDINNVDYNSQITTPSNPFTREGYTFSGWKYNNQSIDENINTTPKDFITDIVLNHHTAKISAQWEKNKYTITYKSNDGMDNYTTQEVLYNTLTNLNSNNFTRDGYSFDHWNTKADGTGKNYSDEESVQLTDHLTLYAIWKVKVYTATFYTNGGSSINRQSIEYGKTVKKPKDPTKTGYNLAGWYKDEGLTQLYDFNTPVTADISLYAKWEKKKFTITYHANDGTNQTTTQEIIYGTTSTLNPNPYTRDQFTFGGWNTKADGSGTNYSNEEEVSLTNNLNLYAIWLENYDFIINNYDVDNTNQYISKVMVNTTVEEYINSIQLNQDYTIEIDHKVVNSKNVLYTGGKTKIYKNNKLYTEYTNVVIGDISGDGIINSTDLLRVRQHLLSKITLSGATFLAADINYDNKINSTDLLRIRQHLLGTRKIQ